MKIRFTQGMDEEDRLFCVGLNHYGVDAENDKELSPIIYIHTERNTLTDRQAQLVRDTYPRYGIRFYELDSDDRKAFAVGYLK